MDRMTGAELAVRRTRLGLAQTELAARLGVHRRTPHDWESERDPIPYGVPAELAHLDQEHRLLTRRYVEAMDAGIPIAVDRQAENLGWHLAALGRALDLCEEPDVAMIDWIGVDEDDA